MFTSILSTLRNISAHCRTFYSLCRGQAGMFSICAIHFSNCREEKYRPMNTNTAKEKRVCLPGCIAEIGMWGGEIKKSVCECGCELVSVTNGIILIVFPLCLHMETHFFFIWMLRRSFLCEAWVWNGEVFIQETNCVTTGGSVATESKHIHILRYVSVCLCWCFVCGV